VVSSEDSSEMVAWRVIAWKWSSSSAAVECGMTNSISVVEEEVRVRVIPLFEPARVNSPEQPQMATVREMGVGR
jgi:hypothetical protein